MARIEIIDVVRLDLTAYELDLIKQALAYMVDGGAYRTSTMDDDAAALLLSLNG